MQHTKPSGMSAHEKIRSWNAIEQNLHAPREQFLYRAFWGRAQSRIVATILGIALLGGGATTAFAHNAKPGDALFPIAIATEKAQILFAGDQKTKESLRIKFAEKRLLQVRALALELATTTRTISPHASTTSSLSSSTTSPIISREDAKKIARTEKAISIALLELNKTRNILLVRGNLDAVSIIDDIIAELRGVGDGSVTILRVAAKEGHEDSKLALRAIFNATSSATSTTLATLNIEDRKGGAKITINKGKVETEIKLGNQKKDDKKEWGEENKIDREDHRDKKHEEDDEDERENHDRGRGGREDERKIIICHSNSSVRQSLTVSTSAGRAHLAHGDHLGRCVGEATATSTPPATDTAAPIISSIAAQVSTTGATITWMTSEGTKTQMWIGTSTSVDTSIAPALQESVFAIAHSAVRSGLSPQTTYHYILSVVDAAGNQATSSTQVFTTNALPPPADVTPPTISSINSATSTTGATVSWLTNELTTSLLYVGTTNPVDLSGTKLVLPTSNMSHSATLSGLNASTTYHFMVVATDGVGNTATSSVSSFSIN